MKLVTDGKLWAIRRGWLKKQWFVLNWQYWASNPIDNCWTDKETAEMWYRRLTA